MVAGIKKHVLTCDVCCRNKNDPLPNHAGFKSYQGDNPMEKVHLDFLGSLPHTKNGNKYNLTLVNSFTKWVECIQLPS